VQFHFASNASKERVAGPLARRDLHRASSTSALLVESPDDVGGSQRDPLFFGEAERCEKDIQGTFRALDRRGENLFPIGFELGEELSRLGLGGSLADGAHSASHGLLEFPGKLGQSVPCHVDLTALHPGFQELPAAELGTSPFRSRRSLPGEGISSAVIISVR
jgi:hypothetical protein